MQRYRRIQTCGRKRRSGQRAAHKAYRKLLQYGRVRSLERRLDRRTFAAYVETSKLDTGNAKEISEVAGNYYVDMNEYGRAIEEYSKCVPFDPEKLSVFAAGIKGRVYAAQGDAVNAEKCFMEAGKWGDFAAFQFSNGKKDAAFKTVLDAVKKDPQNVKQAFGWFSARANIRRFASISKGAETYIEKDPALGREFARMTANAMQDRVSFVIAPLRM